MKDILLIVLVLFIIFQIYTCKHQSNVISEMDRMHKIDSQQIQRHVDEEGRQHAVIEVAKSSNEVISKVFAMKLDSISKIFDIKNKKNIQEVMELAFKAYGKGRGTVTVPVGPERIVHDTVDGIARIDTIDQKLSIDTSMDKHLTFNADIFKTGKFRYSYTYTDSLMAVKHNKKYGLFNLRKREVYDLAFSNKDAIITGLKQFEKESPAERRRIFIGPTFGYGWYGKGMKFGPTFGISIGYGLFRL